MPPLTSVDWDLDAIVRRDYDVFSGRVRLQHHWLRGAIAEQLLKRKAPLPKPAWLSGGESAEAWRSVLDDLTQRGLQLDLVPTPDLVARQWHCHGRQQHHHCREPHP